MEAVNLASAEGGNQGSCGLWAGRSGQRLGPSLVQLCGSGKLVGLRAGHAASWWLAAVQSSHGSAAGGARGLRCPERARACHRRAMEAAGLKLAQL